MMTKRAYYTVLLLGFPWAAWWELTQGGDVFLFLGAVLALSCRDLYRIWRLTCA